MSENIHRLCDTIVKIIGGLVALAAFLWSVEQYKDANERSFYFTYWNKKLDAYANLCRTAAAVALSGGDAPQRGEFLQTYYSTLGYTDPDVAQTAKAFLVEYQAWARPQLFPTEKLETLSENLSRSCTTAIRGSWDTRFLGSKP